MDTPTKEDQQLAMLAHLAVFAGYVVPLASVLGPLVLWQLKKDRPYIVHHAKESLNFHLTAYVALLLCVPLVLVFVGFLLLPVVAATHVVLSVMAAVRANNGELYRYPVSIRFIS